MLSPLFDLPSFRLWINPQGELGCLPLVSDASQNAESTDLFLLIQQAFVASSGDGLLLLAAKVQNFQKSPEIRYWQRFCQHCVVQLSNLANLEQRRQHFDLQPPEDLGQWLASLPPMHGGEYLDLEGLKALWWQIQKAIEQELQFFDGTVEKYLQQKYPQWHLFGKVCFHLAENKKEGHLPFAFLATFAKGLSPQAKQQHVPLSEILRHSSTFEDRQAMLQILLPIQKAAEQSPWLQQLFESKALFRPLAWRPVQAYAFLKEVPIFEQSGIKVRLPNWWRQKASRPQVNITVGKQKPKGFGVQSLLDFDKTVSLGDVVLNEEEINQLLKNTEGLAQIRGSWVEVDNQKLQATLEHWHVLEKQYRSGITFAEGVRLLAGFQKDQDKAIDASDATKAKKVSDVSWSEVHAGAWLEEALKSLNDPQALQQPQSLQATLRPYQLQGLQWLFRLYSLGLGGCLADDMGLGKTMQILALLLLLKEQNEAQPSLLIVPATLLSNWRQEAQRFAQSLRLCLLHPSENAQIASFTAADAAAYDLVVTTYGMLSRLPVLQQIHWHVIVVDEAQAIKNSNTQQAKVVKLLQGKQRLALTGTPIENHLGDLWSLFDFINPSLLGSAASFSKHLKYITSDNGPGYQPLRKLLQPYLLRRLKTDKRIIDDLPEKTEVLAFCMLTPMQVGLYQQAVDELESLLENRVSGIQRRGVILAMLSRFKQICNHPSQWLADGFYKPEHSGKFQYLAKLCQTFAQRQEKVLIFTQFKEITDILAAFLKEIFGYEGLVLHGGTPVKQRQKFVKMFQEDPLCPFFVLSLKAGGTGLNLTAASQVIHFDRWWNPAVENQATDRAFRIGQKRHVLVHKFVCQGTIEERIEEMLQRKLKMSDDILNHDSEKVLTEMSNEQLLDMVRLDLQTTLEQD